MSREKKLIKNTAVVAMGQIGTKFISFFLLPLYTAILSTEEYGTVDLLNTYISLLLPLIFLQLDQAVFRFLIDYRNKNEERNKLISTVLITIIVQAILYLIFFGFIGIFIENRYKYFLATNVVAAMFSSVLLQVSRGLGDNFTYSLGSLVSGAGTIILNVVFLVIFKWGATGMLLASLLSNTLCSIFVFLRLKLFQIISVSRWKKQTLKDLWKYSIPLVPNALSWWIISASDRTILTHFLGVAANGIYSASNKFSAIVITVFSIFSLTWTESASLTINDEDSSDYFSNIINQTIKLFAFICLLIIAIMPFIFKYMIIGDGFAAAYLQIPILILATFFNIVVSLFGSIYVALKKSTEIAKTSIYSAMINIVTNLLLIQYIGLFAASLSTLVAYISMVIYRYFDIKKYVILKIDIKFVFTLMPIITFTLLGYYFGNFYFKVFNIVLIVFLSIYYNFSLLRNMMKLAGGRVRK